MKHSPSIILGTADGKDIRLDLDTLMKTRLLIQANSGGGKSWLLRRLAEQLFGKVPVIIIDPEGEFATLREKFGFVLVGKNGETPADARSAALVAHKLLELRASAVCDLYELKPHERHHWVKLFLEGLINAPKNLWRPTVIIIDEAHVFCPEGKAGESEASGSVVDLATRGRKRRFCAILATQRLGKLRKDATAELLNRLVGPTFEDVDLERAADLLSVPSHDKHEFFEQMRMMPPGSFFALGRALCLKRTLLQVGPVQTSHEIEDAKYGVDAPPLPDAIKALLPKLADLPKAAEEKARTEAELLKKIAELNRQLREKNIPVAVVAPAKAKEIEVVREVAVIKEAQLKRLEALAAKASTFNEMLATILLQVSKKPQPHPAPAPPPRQLPIARPPRPASAPRVNLHPNDADSQNGEIDGRQQKILDVVAMLNVRGLTPNRDMVARWLNLHPNGGSYGSNLGALRAAGFLNGFDLTDKGQAKSQPMETGLARARATLETRQQTILDALQDGAEFDRESLAAHLGLHPNGGSYGTNLGRLRTMGLIPERGTIKLTEAAFA
jgi:hypothetical protein